jgi:Fe-S-cluster containining protein
MFECDKCGPCCMNLNLNPLYKGLDRGDGVCMHFDEKTHLCRIYVQRPLICNIDEMYKLYYSKLMCKEEYYRLNQKSCEILKNKGVI